MYTKIGGVFHFLFVDFGVAASIESKYPHPLTESKGFTAPEQLNGDNTLKSDIYSLGKTFFKIMEYAKFNPSEDFLEVLNCMVQELSRKEKNEIMYELAKIKKHESLLGSGISLSKKQNLSKKKRNIYDRELHVANKRPDCKELIEMTFKILEKRKVVTPELEEIRRGEFKQPKLSKVEELREILEKEKQQAKEEQRITNNFNEASLRRIIEEKDKEIKKLKEMLKK